MTPSSCGDDVLATVRRRLRTTDSPPKLGKRDERARRQRPWAARAPSRGGWCWRPVVKKCYSRSVLRSGLNRAIRFAADKSAVLDVCSSALQAPCGEPRRQSWADITEEVFLARAPTPAFPIATRPSRGAKPAAASSCRSNPSVREAGTKAHRAGQRAARRRGHRRSRIGSFHRRSAALTMITNGVYRDPASVFSAKDCYHLAKTFETLVVRLHIADQAGDQILRLGVLDALAFRRDGEDDDEPGRARVAASEPADAGPRRDARRRFCGGVRRVHESTVTVVHPGLSLIFTQGQVVEPALGFPRASLRSTWTR